MYFQNPIIVVGAPRSGTSLTAGILDACGAFGGDLRQADQNNRKGYFENPAIAEMFDRIIREYALVSLFKKHGIVETEDMKVDTDIVRRMVAQILRQQGYQGGPWYFKYLNTLNNPKLIHAFFPNASWVLVRRNDHDVRASMCNLGHFFESRARIDPAEHFLKKIDVFKSEVPDHTEVWPFEMLADDVNEFRPLIEQLRLTWNEDAVKAFADTSLVHNDHIGFFPPSPVDTLS